MHIYEIIKINLIKIVPYLFDVIIKCKLIWYFKGKKSFLLQIKETGFPKDYKEAA